MLMLFRDRIRKHSRAQALVLELILCLLVSNGWTGWVFLVTSSKRHQHQFIDRGARAQRREEICSK